MRKTRPIPALTDSDLTRFWEKVEKRGPDDCWLWTACVFPRTGYGAFGIRGGLFGAHRIALSIAKGDPGALYALHRCDMPGCCNPTHLYAGDSRQNMRDAVNRGRLNPARGERAGPAKLTEAAVRDIRARCAAGEPQRAVGRAHGVNQASVSEIVRYLNWRHVA